MKILLHCLLAVLLALAVTSTVAHGSVHADPGADQCLLCSSHTGGNPVAVDAAQPFTISGRPAPPPALAGVAALVTRPGERPGARAPPIHS